MVFCDAQCAAPFLTRRKAGRGMVPGKNRPAASRGAPHLGCRRRREAGGRRPEADQCLRKARNKLFRTLADRPAQRMKSGRGLPHSKTLARVVVGAAIEGLVAAQALRAGVNSGRPWKPSSAFLKKDFRAYSVHGYLCSGLFGEGLVRSSGA
jgi:hypothetical protein